jgi:hypothetical protein
MPVKTPIPLAPYTKIFQNIIVQMRAPVENLQATPTSLPTAEPATSQWSKTLASTDFPTITPTPYNVAYVACVYLAGKNTETAGQTVYWRMIKNGASVATGSAGVSAGYYYTVNASFFGVVAGDVIEVRLWATSANVNWDYDGFQIQPSRLVTAEALNSPCYVNFRSLASNPLLVKGNPSISTYYSLTPYHLDTALPTINAPASYDVLYPKATYCLYRLYAGDYSSSNTASVTTDSTYRPRYVTNYVPLTISLVIWKFW